MEEQQFLKNIIKETSKALSAGGYDSIEYYDENIVAMNGPSGENLDGEETVARMLKPTGTDDIVVTLSYNGDGKYMIIVTLGDAVDFTEFDKTAGDILKRLAGKWGAMLDYRLDTWGGEISSKEDKDNIKKQIRGDNGEYIMETRIAEAKNAMTGTTRSSYQRVGECKVIIRHVDKVNEYKFGARSRNINSIFIETKGGERFKMAENNLHGARAMARHLSNSGSPFDSIGSKITTMMEEMKQLRIMVTEARKMGRKRTLSEEQVVFTSQLKGRYVELRENLKRMSGKVGYVKYSTDTSVAHDFTQGTSTISLQEKEDMKIDTETKASKNKKEEDTVLKDQVPVYDRPKSNDDLSRDADDLFSVNENKYGTTPEEVVLENWFNNTAMVEFFEEGDLVIEEDIAIVEKILPENALSMLNVYMGHPLFDHYIGLYEKQEILDAVLSLIEEDSKLWETVTTTRVALSEFSNSNEITDMDAAMKKVQMLISDRRLSIENAINDVVDEIVGETDDEPAREAISKKIWGIAEKSGLIKHDFGSTFSDQVLAPNDTVSAHTDEIEAEEYYGDAKFAESASPFDMDTIDQESEWANTYPGNWATLHELAHRGYNYEELLQHAREEFDVDMNVDDIDQMVYEFATKNNMQQDGEFDDQMDGDDETALASAGLGSDEDYGDFGGNDFYEMNKMRKNAGMEPLIRESNGTCSCGHDVDSCDCGSDCKCGCNDAHLDEGDPFGRQSKRNLKNPKARMSLINPEDSISSGIKSLGEDEVEEADAYNANKMKKDKETSERVKKGLKNKFKDKPYMKEGSEEYVEVDMPHHLPQTATVHDDAPILSEDGARIIELARYRN